MAAAIQKLRDDEIKRAEIDDEKRKNANSATLSTGAVITSGQANTIYLNMNNTMLKLSKKVRAHVSEKERNLKRQILSLDIELKSILSIVSELKHSINGGERSGCFSEENN